MVRRPYGMLALFTPARSTCAPLVLLAAASLAAVARPRAAPPAAPAVVIADPPRPAPRITLRGVMLAEGPPPASCIDTLLCFDVSSDPGLPPFDGHPVDLVCFSAPCFDIYGQSVRELPSGIAGNARELVGGGSYELTLEATEPSLPGDMPGLRPVRIDDAPSPWRATLGGRPWTDGG